MLLRRITEHIKAQNWFAVTLDFLIVVFGVFIGFQVDNWNEARKEAAQENTYLVRLYNDMTATISRNERQIALMMQQGGRAGVVVNSLRKCNLQESDRIEFANGIYHLGKIFPVYLVKGTIEELVSTGKIGTVQNNEITAQLDRVIEDYEEKFGIAPAVNARITPQIIYIDSTIAYVIESPHEGSLDINWKNIDFNFEELCKDRRFYAAVSAIRNYTYDVIAQNTEVLIGVRKLHRLLERELNSASQ